MPRTGRPKATSPKTHMVGVRLTEYEFQRLVQYAARQGKVLSVVVRQEILKLVADKEK